MLTLEAGDATDPTGIAGSVIIAHVVNDVGAWGKGFVVALAKRHPQARSAYRREWKRHMLGQVQLVPIGDDLSVANMFAQHGIGRGQRRLRYPALRRCLENLASSAKILDATVLMPQIGCGLAGGDWEVVRALIKAEMRGVRVVVRGGGR